MLPLPRSRFEAIQLKMFLRGWGAPHNYGNPDLSTNRGAIQVATICSLYMLLVRFLTKEVQRFQLEYIAELQTSSSSHQL